MGFSWALYYCQAAVVGLVRQAHQSMVGNSERFTRLVLDGLAVAPVAPGRPWWFAYVDNIIAWGWNAEDAKRALVSICDVLDHAGLDYKIECSGAGNFDVIGFNFDARNRVIINKPDRVHRLSRGALGLASLGRCTPKVLQVTAGLLTHALGLRRCALSVLQCIFAEASDDNSTVIKFSDDTADELVVSA